MGLSWFLYLQSHFLGESSCLVSALRVSHAGKPLSRQANWDSSSPYKSHALESVSLGLLPYWVVKPPAPPRDAAVWETHRSWGEQGSVKSCQLSVRWGLSNILSVALQGAGGAEIQTPNLASAELPLLAAARRGGRPKLGVTWNLVRESLKLDGLRPAV